MQIRKLYHIIVEAKLNPKGPIYQRLATNCLMEVIRNQFTPINQLVTVITSKNLSTGPYEIQSNLIREINRLIWWSLEVIDGPRIDFESRIVCVNCPRKNKKEKKILKYNFHEEIEASFVLMVSENISDFKEQISYYVASKLFNGTAFFLVFYSEVTENYRKNAKLILDHLWDLQIFNMAIMLPKNSLNRFVFYGVKVFAPSELCGYNPKQLLLDECIDGKLQKQSNFYSKTLPEKFGNCSLNVIGMKYPPFVLDTKRGFEMVLLNEIGKFLNINYIFSIEQDAQHWGLQKKPRNWTGLLGEVYKKWGLGIGNVLPNPNVAEDFDFSSSYFFENMVWIVPIAIPIARWKNIFIIFHYSIWLITIGYLLLTAFLLKIRADKRYQNFGYNVMICLRMIVVNAVPQQPKTDITRTFFLFFALYGLLFSSAFQSIFMNFLTNPVYETQISSVSDILNHHNMGVGGLASYRDFFNEPDDKDAYTIYKIYEIVPEEEDTAYNWMEPVANDRDTSTVTSGLYIRYLLSTRDPAVTTKSGKSKIFILKKVVFSYPLSFVFPKGYPLKETFDKVISCFIRGGFIAKWASEYHESDDMGSDENEVKSLSIEHLQGPIVVLIFGHLVSILTFFFELIIDKIRDKDK